MKGRAFANTAARCKIYKINWIYVDLSDVTFDYIINVICNCPSALFVFIKGST